MLKNIVLLCIAVLNARGARMPNDYYWNGKWFPHTPGDTDSNPAASMRNNLLHDSKDGVTMGIVDPSCDDAKTALATDWFMDPENFTCFGDKHLYRPKTTVHPIHSTDHIPSEYNAPHKCMNETIPYGDPIPTFGTHRPLWAVYGEYTFAPKQRWLHNLEHGALVMLYHPCANKNQVNILKKIVKSCLYKHVITPYDQLTVERPLALLTWGHRLEMSKVAGELIVDFIRKYALKGPEKTTRDGQYSLALIERARIVSDIDDSSLCPSYAGIHMK